MALDILKAEAEVVTSTLREKGHQRFGKIIALALIFGALSYFGLYRPPRQKIAMLAREVEKTRALSEVGAQYKDLRNQLAAAYALLPTMTERDHWLAAALIDSLKAETLNPDMMKPIVEDEAAGLIFQSSMIQLTSGFKEAYQWLMRVERARPLMHVRSLDVQKKTELLGVNIMTADVMTVIPKKRFN
ncbi:MAG: hypothetical protein AAB036_10255 [Elusimicrobiota bacterium]